MDPSIILAGKSPVYEPLAVAAARQQTLKNAIMANQHTAVMNPQIEQAGALTLQQQQRAERDQQIYADAIANRARSTLGAAAGGPAVAGGLMDPGMINDLAKGGMSGGGLQGVTQNYLKQLETKSIADKNAAESKHYDVETAGLRLRAAGNAANAVLQLPVEQRPAGYARARGDLIQQGYATADQIPEQYPGDDVLQQHANQALEADKLQAMQIKANEERRAAALAPFQLQTAATNAQTGQLGLAGQTLGAAANQDQWTAARSRLTPEQQATIPPVFSPAAAAAARRVGMSGEQQTAADQAAANAAETARRNTATAAHEAETARQGWARVGIENANLKLQREKLGFDMSGGVSPSAQAAVNGQMSPASVRAMLRSQPGLRKQMLDIDPGWDESVLQNRYDTAHEFSNTSLSHAGGQSLALNTLVHHADLYLQAAEALKNHTFVPGNAAYNAVATMFGHAPPQNAALVARFLAGETGKVATGGVPAEGEINGILKNLNTSGSEEQLANAGKMILQIAGGRAVPLMERVHKAKLDSTIDVLGPDAQDILKRRGFNPTTMQPAAGGGGATPAKNPYRSDR